MLSNADGFQKGKKANIWSGGGAFVSISMARDMVEGSNSLRSLFFHSPALHFHSLDGYISGQEVSAALDLLLLRS